MAHPTASVILYTPWPVATTLPSSLSARHSSYRLAVTCRLWSSCCSLYLFWTPHFKWEKECKSQLNATVLTLSNKSISQNIFFEGQEYISSWHFQSFGLCAQSFPWTSESYNSQQLLVDVRNYPHSFQPFFGKLVFSIWSFAPWQATQHDITHTWFQHFRTCKHSNR